MISRAHVTPTAIALLFLPSLLFSAQKGEILSGPEQDNLREEQDPARRIEVYLDIADQRLNTFETYRSRPPDPKYDYGTYLDELLGEYIGVYDELKNWIEYQYQRDGDMRPGLRALLDRSTQQLAVLRRIDQSPNDYASNYEFSLQDAIDQVTDTLDGATRALADQEKKFPEIKREKKEAVRLAKERAREEKKRTKEEKELRKRLGKDRVPGDSGED